MISSDLGKLYGFSPPGPLCPFPLRPFSLASSSDVLLEEFLELLKLGAILLRNRNVLKTSLILWFVRAEHSTNLDLKICNDIVNA